MYFSFALVGMQQFTQQYTDIVQMFIIVSFYVFHFCLGRHAIIHSTVYCYCTNAHSCELLCISLLSWQACTNSLNSILILYKCSFL